MPSFFKSAAALAMAGAAVANPLFKRSDDDCLAAVTGKAALGDESLRKEHCTSFFKTIVTPAAVTVTTTITDAPKTSNWNQWEKKDVTVCPNEVPNYASACNLSGYSSACKAWGVIGETTFTIPATTTTKTVYVGTGKDGVCSATTVTKTDAGSTTTVAGSTTTVAGSTTVVAGFTTTVAGSTTTVAGSTVTVAGSISTTIITVTANANITIGGSPSTVTVTVPSAGPTGGSTFPNNTISGPNGPSIPGCLTADKAKEFTDAFKNLLEFTNQGTPGVSAPYNANISAKYLAVDFKDYSDSINWMSGRTLGSVTFASRAEFDSEQGSGQQPITITSELSNFGCKHITWRWSALTATYGQVTGVNHMVLTDDLTQIQTNYAEFNDAAWVQSLAVLPYPGFDKINCVVPSLSGGAASNGTATTSTTTVAVTVTSSATASASS